MTQSTVQVRLFEQNPLNSCNRGLAEAVMPQLYRISGEGGYTVRWLNRVW